MRIPVYRVVVGTFVLLLLNICYASRRWPTEETMTQQDIASKEKKLPNNNRPTAADRLLNTTTETLAHRERDSNNCSSSLEKSQQASVIFGHGKIRSPRRKRSVHTNLVQQASEHVQENEQIAYHLLVHGHKVMAEHHKTAKKKEHKSRILTICICVVIMIGCLTCTICVWMKANF